MNRSEKISNAIVSLAASVTIVTFLVLVLSAAWWLILDIWANLPSRY